MTSKIEWVKPELETLNVEKTLSGGTPLDQEATFNNQDQFIGGPQS